MLSDNETVYKTSEVFIDTFAVARLSTVSKLIKNAEERIFRLLQ